MAQLLEDYDELYEDTPLQDPKITALEATRITVTLANRAAVEWLMDADGRALPDLESLLKRPDWHQEAACRGADPDLFFPERGHGRPEEALAYCEDCAVKSECLSSSLEVASTTGVWGGTTGIGRRGLKRSVA